MENPHHNPIVNGLLQIYLYVASALCYTISIMSVDDFREWTFWILSVGLLLLNIWNHKIVKDFMRKFKKKKK